VLFFSSIFIFLSDAYFMPNMQCFEKN